MAAVRSALVGVTRSLGARPAASLRAVSARGMCSAEGPRPATSQVDNMMQIGARRIFNADHDMFRQTVRGFYETEVTPHHEKWEEEGHVPRELWQAAGASGLLGITMPEEYGGAGADILYAAINWEEQSYTGCTGPGWALHSEICMPYILKYGTPAQKEKYLPKLCSGEWISAIAMTEPGAGSDLQGVRTTAVPDGDDWLISGSKTFITNGFHSDVVIVVAKTDPSKGAHGISLFFVEAGMEGFEKGRKLKKMGLRAQDTSELFFDNVRVPKENLLGGEAGLNKGFFLLMSELPQERLLIADMAVAASEAVYEWTREYVKERKAFGKTILDLQVTKHKLAEMKTEVAVARSFVDDCLELHAEEKLDSPMASMAKYWATDMQCKVADRAVQLHGGNGFMLEYPVTRAFMDARVQPIYGGTNEIMKELIARTL